MIEWTDRMISADFGFYKVRIFADCAVQRLARADFRKMINMVSRLCIRYSDQPGVECQAWLDYWHQAALTYSHDAQRKAKLLEIVTKARSRYLYE